jgi:protein-disulfide isomerase
MRRTRFSTIFAVSTFVVFASQLAAQSAASQRPIARIGDQAIYDDDLLPLIQGQLLQLRNQEYELRSKTLDSLVSQRLLEAEARKKGISVEVMLQRLDQDLPPWHIQELEGFYLAQKDRINRPFDEVKTELERSFVEAKRQQARQTYIAGLREKAGVAILLGRPRVDVTVDPARLRGDPGALVTVVEFADFQCPYCQSVQPAMKQVMEKYRGKIRLGFRDFPLRSIHPQAQSAAEASRCAGEQGKYWEYYDLLFANQTALNPENYKQFARALGLEPERFDACLASGRSRPLIDNDFQTGTAAGVSGTPAFFINGILLSGSQSASAFEKIIDGELTKPGSR